MAQEDVDRKTNADGQTGGQKGNWDIGQIGRKVDGQDGIITERQMDRNSERYGQKGRWTQRHGQKGSWEIAHMDRKRRQTEKGDGLKGRWTEGNMDMMAYAQKDIKNLLDGQKGRWTDKRTERQIGN